MVDNARGGRTVKKNLNGQTSRHEQAQVLQTHHQEMADHTWPWKIDETSGYLRFKVVLGAHPSRLFSSE